MQRKLCYSLVVIDALHIFEGIRIIISLDNTTNYQGENVSAQCRKLTFNNTIGKWASNLVLLQVMSLQQEIFHKVFAFFCSHIIFKTYISRSCSKLTCLVRYTCIYAIVRWSVGPFRLLVYGY